MLFITNKTLLQNITDGTILSNLIQPQKATPGTQSSSPSEKLLNNEFDLYCPIEREITESDIRDLAPLITKYAQLEMLNTLTPDRILRFFDIVSKSLQNSPNYPFDLVSIALKILSQPEMPQSIYSDIFVKRIVKHLHKFCYGYLFKITQDSKEEPLELHSLPPIISLLAEFIAQVPMHGSLLSSALSLAISCYFLQNSSPNLQNTAMQLILAIYTRYEDMRDTVMQDIFLEIEKGKPTPKYLLFRDGERKQISGNTRILLEIPQSIVSFPDDNEYSRKGTISNIVSSVLEMKFLLRFCEDISICVSHPNYPIAFEFCNILSEQLFSIQLSNRPIPNITKALGQLTTAMARIRYAQLPEVSIPLDIANEISEVEMSGPNLTIGANDIKVTFNNSFPANPSERLLAELSILTPYRWHKSACKFFIGQWSLQDIHSAETVNLLTWWKGNIPVKPLPTSIAEIMHIALMKQKEVIKYIYIVCERFLGGLEHKSSTVRSQTLKSFADIVALDPKLLFHEKLVPYIKDAFIDPSVGIRRATLEIVSQYVENDQRISSNYFATIANCILDSDKSLVGRAMQVIEVLAKTAPVEEQIKACKSLLRVNPDSSIVGEKLPMKILRQIVFQDDTPENALAILSELLCVPGYVKWFKPFIKETLVSKEYSKKMENLIHHINDELDRNPSKSNVLMLKYLSESVPKYFAQFFDDIYQKVETLFISTDDQDIEEYLADALTPLFAEVGFITVSLGLFEKVRTIIEQGSPAVNNSVIRMVSAYIANQDPENQFLAEIFDRRLKLGRKEFASPTPSPRNLFICSCILRFNPNMKEAKKQADGLFMLIGSLFIRKPSDVMCKVASSIATDCIIINSSQAKNAKQLIAAFFKQNVYLALDCIEQLLEKEENSPAVHRVDEIAARVSPEIVRTSTPDIQQAFLSTDFQVQTKALNVTQAIFKADAGNPHNFLQYISAVVCTPLHDQALDALKMLAAIREPELLQRIDDGLVIAKKVARGPHSHSFGDIIQVLSKPGRTAFLSRLIKRANDPWVAEVIARTPLLETAEPVWIIREISKKIDGQLSACLFELRAAVNILAGLTTKQTSYDVSIEQLKEIVYLHMLESFMYEKYNLTFKLVAIDMRRKRKLKVNLVDIPNFGMVQFPDFPLEFGTKLLNFFAKFSSICRRERYHESCIKAIRLDEEAKRAEEEKKNVSK